MPRRKRRSDVDGGESVTVTFKKQMDATNFTMSGGSVSELRDILQEKTKIEFMAITGREPKTQMKLLNFKDVNGLEDAEAENAAIDMPFGAKLHDIEAEATDNEEIQLGRIFTRGEEFRHMQHGTGFCCAYLLDIYISIVGQVLVSLAIHICIGRQ